jgi:hypothetical protein
MKYKRSIIRNFFVGLLSNSDGWGAEGIIKRYYRGSVYRKVGYKAKTDNEAHVSASEILSNLKAELYIGFFD